MSVESNIAAGRAKGVVGAVGVPIPPDAPAERTAEPLTPDAVAAARAAAATNERELPPLRPPGPSLTPAAKIAQLQSLGLPVPAELMVAAGAGRPTRRLPRPAVTASGGSVLVDEGAGADASVSATRTELGPEHLSPPVTAAAARPAQMPSSGWPTVALPDANANLIEPNDLPDAPLAGALPQPGDADYGEIFPLADLPPLTDADRARMPAASNTDSPARGIPKPIAVKDKQITGGFGDVLDAQYFPLSGDELGVLITAQLDHLKAIVQSDLRFSIGLTYPRVRAKISIEIEGDVEDAGFQILRVVAPADGEPGSTPLDLARQAANTEAVCFVVQTLRQEFDETDQSDLPPDAIRDELGLPKPGKRMIISGGRRQFVDVLGSDLRATTGGGR